MAMAMNFKHDVVIRINDRARRLAKYLEPGLSQSGLWKPSTAHVKQSASFDDNLGIGSGVGRGIYEDKIRAGLAKAGQKVKNHR